MKILLSSIQYYFSTLPTTTTSSLIPLEFSNCTNEFKLGKDEHYITCFKFLSNDSDFCEYLKFVNLAFTFPYYFLGLIPLILSLFALIINLIFIYITVLILLDINNPYVFVINFTATVIFSLTLPSRTTYVFLLNRSISTIIAQIMLYIILIAWKKDGFGYLSTVIFLTIGSLSFLTLAGTYFILSIRIYVITILNINFLTITKCAILNGAVWIYNVIFSLFIGIYGSTLVYPEQTKIICEFERCQRPLAIFVTVLLGISYFGVLAAYFGALIKLKIKTMASKGRARHINSQNIILMRRFLYNIFVFALTKIPLLVICGFTLYDLDNLKNLGKGEETSCKKFLHGKLYFKVELLASITVFVILLGMIVDPIISIYCDFADIKVLAIIHFKNLLLKFKRNQ